MFTVGQRVWHRNGQRSGKVVECDGDQVYIIQDNGAEMDVRASDLTTTPPAGAPAPGNRLRERGDAPRPEEQVVPTRVLRPSDITPEHVRVLGIIPMRTVQTVAALYERRPKAGKFSALDVAGKLNVIAEITAVPYRIMRDCRDRPGELGLLMGKGLADSSRQG